MELLSNMTKMCWNTTDVESRKHFNCSNHGLNYLPNEIEATTENMQRDVAMAEMVFSLRYYIEGVILTPVATIGLFGMYNKCEIYLFGPSNIIK